MSHFYANIKGSRGEATRCGTKTSGMEGHIRGWDLGAKVIMSHDEHGQDLCTVFITGGSNGESESRCLGTFKSPNLIKND